MKLVVSTGQLQNLDGQKMGYRSEVAIAMTLDIFEEIKSLLDEDDQDEMQTYSVSYEDQVLLHYGSIKWYDSYKLVNLFEDYLKKFPDKMRMLRVGDELDDYEEVGNLNDKFDLSFSRSINFNDCS